MSWKRFCLKLRDGDCKCLQGPDRQYKAVKVSLRKASGFGGTYGETEDFEIKKKSLKVLTANGTRFGRYGWRL